MYVNGTEVDDSPTLLTVTAASCPGYRGAGGRRRWAVAPGSSTAKWGLRGERGWEGGFFLAGWGRYEAALAGSSAEPRVPCARRAAGPTRAP